MTTRLLLLFASLLVLVAHADDKAPSNPMHITLTKKTVERRGDHWVVKVGVKFTNTGKKVFELDKLTAALDGKVGNDVFSITSASGPLEYRGMMMKRAPPGPSGFAKVAPGAWVETVIDLGETYGFPAAGGRFTVKFRSANHFSVDDVQLESDELVLVLPP